MFRNALATSRIFIPLRTDIIIFFEYSETALSQPDKHTYHHGFYVCSNCHPVLVKGGGMMKNNFYMASSANGIHELNPVL